jgi:plasmid rolling circle replication initiator protein Rep
MSEQIDAFNELHFLKDYSKRDAVWDKHKRDAVKIADFIEGDEEFDKFAKRLRETANDLDFKWIIDHTTGEAKLKLSSAWFSRWRHDPVSNWRKSMKWRSLWINALPKVFEAYPTHKFVFLTLTVQNCKIEDLKATCKHLNKSFLKLLRGKKLAKYFYIRDKSAPIAGYYKALEITKESDVFDKKGVLIKKGREGYAHPHIHALLHLPATYFKNGYISQKDFAELWQNAAGLDYSPVIDVRLVKPKKNSLDDKFGGLFDSVLEVTKYPNKAADLLICPDWTKEYIRQMNRVRLTDVGGTLREFIKDERFDEDLVHIDEENDDETSSTESHLFFEFNHQKTVLKYVKKTP